MPLPTDTAALNRCAEVFTAVERNVGAVFEGKLDVVEGCLVALLAQGHVLIEDVPGVGKTLLAKALARSVSATVQRVQFTPDLLPGDITGLTVYHPERGTFTFRPGAVFTNVLLGDEINRAGPKTQSALLEAMEERTVTIDGTSHELPEPFFVIATQNPVELDGTYPLPEAQRDRFMLRLRIGYPSLAAEVGLLDGHGAGQPLSRLGPVTDAEEVTRFIAVARGVHADPAVQRYIVDLVRQTRNHPALTLGASPRASLALLRAARALAAGRGRGWVEPGDIKRLAVAVLGHRLMLTPAARREGTSGADVVEELLGVVAVPEGRS